MSNANDNVVDLRGEVVRADDPELLAMIEELLVRARDGHVMGIAIVEHQRGDAVVVQVSRAGNYHYVHSGAARLAHMLAGIDNP